CRFHRVDFSGGNWEQGVWRDCDLTDGNLANVHTRRCLLQRSRLTTMRATGLQWTDGSVKDVTITGCRLDLAGFRFSKLRHVVFDDCRLTGADFTNADLTGTVWRDCDLTEAKFHHATMTSTRLENCVVDGISGVDAMNGATIASADLLSLTYSLARAHGITIEHPAAD
ncbi:MAG: pentapeptide repeat-containing protein, partial [Stackebrandtia sp.]